MAFPACGQTLLPLPPGLHDPHAVEQVHEAKEQHPARLLWQFSESGAACPPGPARGRQPWPKCRMRRATCRVIGLSAYACIFEPGWLTPRVVTHLPMTFRLTRLCTNPSMDCHLHLPLAAACSLVQPEEVAEEAEEDQEAPMNGWTMRQSWSSNSMPNLLEIGPEL